MKFIVDNQVFSALNNVCFGIVVAKGVNNRDRSKEISELLVKNVQLAKQQFDNIPVKQHPLVIPYRDSFLKLGINPNKYACSIEALVSRIVKTGQCPSINNVVDLGNAISLKYTLPIGAHDIDNFGSALQLRYANESDKFLPFGSDQVEQVETGELVYVAGSQVKTRRWIWRQSEDGKIVETSSNIFFPIDGFKDVNYDSVRLAQEELATTLKQVFNCEVQTGFVDANNPIWEEN